MIELHNNGLLNREIADMYDTSKTMVSRIFQELNIPSRHPSLTEERKNKIKDYYLSCYNKRQTCKEMHCGECTLNSIINEYGLYEPTMSVIKRKYDIDEDYFDVIDTQNKAYALGLYYADGSVASNGGTLVRLSLQECDKEILDKLNSEFGGNRKLLFIEYHKKNKNWSNQYCLSISNKKLHNDLIKHGCLPNKSLILKFPTTVPYDLTRHFIRGYFDGDGSLAKKRIGVL